MSECSALFRFTDESGDHRPHSIEEFGEEGQEDDDNDEEEEEEEEDQDEEREKEVMEIDTLLNMDESPPKRRRIKQESETKSD